MVLFDLTDFGYNGSTKQKTDFSFKNAFWLKQNLFALKSFKRTVQF